MLSTCLAPSPSRASFDLEAVDFKRLSLRRKVSGFLPDVSAGSGKLIGFLQRSISGAEIEELLGVVVPANDCRSQVCMRGGG